jgi:hypothetical protein
MLNADRLAYVLKKLRVVVEFVFRKRMQPLQTRIAEHPGRLDDDFI